MLIWDGLLRADSETDVATEQSPASAKLTALLERGLGGAFTILDAASGEILQHSPAAMVGDWGLRAEICREVARRVRPVIIEEEDPLVLLALPVEDDQGNTLVAVGTFLTRPLASDNDYARAATLLGKDPAEIAAWAEGQMVWPAAALLRTAELVQAQIHSQRRIRDLEGEASCLSRNLSSTYEEISLLHRLTQNLRISKSDEDLAQVALDWLLEALPAQGTAIQLFPVTRDTSRSDQIMRAQPVLITSGQCPLSLQDFAALVGQLTPSAGHRPVVVNRPATVRDGWKFPQVRQVILVALAEGENLFGWLAAFNHSEDAEFGTIEANLLASVAAILGIHSGNIELYRQQSELLAGIIRALSSAIDAKDQYTCGHSDRVARIAVRLGKELGCDEKMLNTIYMAGLLHDIGKIGVDDNVLRKPDKLTDEEYEHIKKHVEIGHRILVDLTQLDDILPVVLHHHESWDGRGYPQGLQSRAIPFPARIVAVADSFDAMSSDRPYRKGMPEEKIDAIFRAGSGKQWDPDVVAALFRARDDINRITHGLEQDEGSRVSELVG